MKTRLLDKTDSFSSSATWSSVKLRCYTPPAQLKRSRYAPACSISHFWILSKSQFHLCSVSADYCLLQKRLVSSANMEALVVCRRLGRSLMDKLNSKGLNPVGRHNEFQPHPTGHCLFCKLVFSDVRFKPFETCFSYSTSSKFCQE
jgi:hypothetical protein